jgi:formylglycine-generating enzyme
MLRKYKYDIAISVATEDLGVAKQIAASLEQHRIGHYLYNEQNVEAWGEYVLKVSLAKYGAEAKFILLLVSKSFVKKYWTIIELQIAQAFNKGQKPYILPLRIDDTELDIIKYLGFVNWKNNPEEIALMLKSKVRKRDGKIAKKRWGGALLAIILVLSAYLLFPRSVVPDYSLYFDAFQKGDSLFNSRNIPAAKESYRRALQYNPNDRAAGRKLALLDSIDHFISQRKHDSVKHLLHVLVTIPPSPSLSPEALRQAGAANTQPLQVTLLWSGDTLQITISGGVPFANTIQPYKPLGISCADCVVWRKQSNGYQAYIPASKANVAKIGFKDQLGQFLYQPVPAGRYINPPTTASAPETHSVGQAPASPQVTRATWQDYAHAGDSLFGKKKFTEAKNEYNMALTLKPGDAALTQKRSLCEKELQKQELMAAKLIPRKNIPAGSFTMGTNRGNPADGPAHTVSLGAFSIGITEVTVGQYRQFCKYEGRPMPPGVSTDEASSNLPITNITWAEAMAYCQWVGGQLPTEAEWEYAAAAGSQNIYSGSSQIDQVAWHKGNSNGQPSKVGLKGSNGFGLQDMTGNVAEWCLDWYDKNQYAAGGGSNPQGPASGSDRSVRGGAYNSFVNSAQDGNQLRITYRNSENPTTRKPYIGFRVAWHN